MTYLMIIIKRSIHHEDITIVNIYASNIGTSIYKAKPSELKGGINSNTMRVEDFNNLLSTVDINQQRINKETVDLNKTVDQVDLTDRYRHPPDVSRIHILLKHTENIF